MTRRAADTPYRVTIVPTFGMQADVRAWHRSSSVPILDTSVWGVGIRRRAERVARAACARDAAQRRQSAQDSRQLALDNPPNHRA